MIVKAKSAYSLWFKVVDNIAKTHRYTLGSKIDDNFLQLLELIFLALFLSPDKKIPRLEMAVVKLDSLKFFLQLAWENKSISHKDYDAISNELNEVGKMLGGWKKGLEKKTLASK